MRVLALLLLAALLTISLSEAGITKKRDFNDFAYELGDVPHKVGQSFVRASKIVGNGFSNAGRAMTGFFLALGG